MSIDSTWAARVAAWRGSGLTAADFCARREISVRTLRYWAGRITQAEAAVREVRIAKVVAPGAPLASETAIVLEVGAVRVAVRRGFDRDVLREVIDVLRTSAA